MGHIIDEQRKMAGDIGGQLVEGQKAGDVDDPGHKRQNRSNPQVLL
jgi:hypothetical protein